MKTIKRLICLFGICLVSPVYAFTCYITLVKDNCWLDYNVTVQIIDANVNKNILKISIPKGTAWARQKFTCTPGQNFAFQAQYSPVFWKQDIGKIYNGQNYWVLPAEIKKNETAWNITICYPEQFSEVPLPPTASGACSCNLKDIPPVQPQ